MWNFWPFSSHFKKDLEKLLWDEKSLYDNITLVMGSHKGCQGKSKVIFPKRYKHLAYALTCKMNLFVLFWMKKGRFKAKFDIFWLLCWATFFLIWNLFSHENIIQMSHWHCRTTEGTEFWITCERLAFLSSFSRLQVIQNAAPSVVRQCQCDIWICEWKYDRVKARCFQLIRLIAK